jgi:hypothetical protein
MSLSMSFTQSMFEAAAPLARCREGIGALTRGDLGSHPAIFKIVAKNCWHSFQVDANRLKLLNKYADAA